MLDAVTDAMSEVIGWVDFVLVPCSRMRRGFAAVYDGVSESWVTSLGV